MRLKQSNATPRTERPRIPDYGISKSKAGLLPWEWAVKTLSESHEYWLVTVRSDGRPHAMIIWGLWFDGAFWFGTGSKTQKARNLARNPNCVVGTQNPAEAVILEGVAEPITDGAIQKTLETASLRKYGTRAGDGSEPVYRVRPTRVFGFIEKSFPKPQPGGYLTKRMSVMAIFRQLTHLDRATRRSAAVIGTQFQRVLYCFRETNDLNQLGSVDISHMCAEIDSTD
jgi:hypothetical protein